MGLNLTDDGITGTPLCVTGDVSRVRRTRGNGAVSNVSASLSQNADCKERLSVKTECNTACEDECNTACKR